MARILRRFWSVNASRWIGVLHFAADVFGGSNAFVDASWAAYLGVSGVAEDLYRPVSFLRDAAMRGMYDLRSSTSSIISWSARRAPRVGAPPHGMHVPPTAPALAWADEAIIKLVFLREMREGQPAGRKAVVRRSVLHRACMLSPPPGRLLAQVPEARARGYNPGRFSFNVKGGRCEACQGDGLIKVEMHFLPDIYVPCDTCSGKRYNRETLDIRYKGKNINEVLDMTVEDAAEFFAPVPMLARKLETLKDVGLSYIRLGQSATTLSGGEAQRIKLSRELSKRDTGSTLYILDEPTTGLHFHDIAQLLDVLHRLRDDGNTIVVIEHNLDVIKTADWLVDLGPEGGSGGGEIIATGTPEQVAKIKKSHTGRFLKETLA